MSIYANDPKDLSVEQKAALARLGKLFLLWLAVLFALTIIGLLYACLGGNFRIGFLYFVVVLVVHRFFMAFIETRRNRILGAIRIPGSWIMRSFRDLLLVFLVFASLFWFWPFGR